MEQAERLAAAARDAGVRPDLIWHSGKLRARQTAEAFLRLCNPFATFTMVRGLRPDDPPNWLRDMLEGEDGEVLAAGHMPSIAYLSTMLGALSPIPQNGLVTLERVERCRYVERWRSQGPG